MTNEEKIKEAWGDLFDSFTEEDKKFIISENGYLVHNDFMFIYNDYLLWNDIELIKNPFTNHLYRPKSLKGIENNNGWIKIESEEDLPKENIDCFYITKYSKDVIVGCFRLKSYKGWRNMFTVDHNIAVGLGHVTHYQPIVKPKFPVY